MESLFEGRLGPVRVEDVLQFVTQAGFDAVVSFECDDRADGSLRAVDLRVRDGRLVGFGPRGTGLRLGDLAVLRRLVRRRDLEAAIGNRPPGTPTGHVLLDCGWLDDPSLEDLLWERCARVVWSLSTWDHGTFRVRAPEAGEPTESPVDPPVPLGALLLDGLQRAEMARDADRSGA